VGPRRIFGRLVEVVGILLLVWMLWRVFFAYERTFDTMALGVAFTGILAGWLQGSSMRTRIDAPIVIYVALTALSAFVHRGSYAAHPIVTTDHTTEWRPMIMASYFYGATVLLGGERRLGALIASIVGAISLVGAGASLDNLLFTVHGQPILEYSSVHLWNGYAEVGLLLVVALPLVVAVLVVSRRVVALASAALLALTLLVFTWEIDARAPYVAMAGTLIALAVTEVFWFRRFRLLALGSVCAVILMAVFAAHADWSSAVLQGFRDRFIARYAIHVRANGAGFDTAFGRPNAWRPALSMVRDHPWLGVGPARYTSALRAGGYVPAPSMDDTHAHNLPLQVAAESGVPAALAFLAIWWSLLSGLRRRCGNSRHLNLLAFAFGGVLVAYFIRNLGDHFTSGLFVTSDRIEFLLWTLFAAAAAVIRLPRDTVPATPFT
jgi:O-antigen ligase